MRLRFWKRKKKPVEYNLGTNLVPDFEKYGKTRKVPGVMLQVSKGFSRMSKVHSEAGEIIQPEKDEEIYNGLIPHVVEIDRNVIPSFWMRLFMKKDFRVRMHFRVAEEPFTRDPHDFRIIDPEKQRKVLMERGFIDEEGFLLEIPRTVETKDGKQTVTRKGKRMLVEGCHIKPDVSAIDYITAETLAYKESKNNEEIAKAMAKTGKGDDKLVLYLMLGFMVLVGAIVFMMSGGAEGWF